MKNQRVGLKNQGLMHLDEPMDAGEELVLGAWRVATLKYSPVLNKACNNFSIK